MRATCDAGAPSPRSQRAGPAADEILDAALQRRTLVDVLVPGEHDVDGMLDEQRLENQPVQLDEVR